MPTPELSRHAALADRIIGNIVQASSPAVSPDGSQVAFVVTRVVMETNKYRSQVWLAVADGSTPPRVLTSGDNDGNPAWSPDGRELAFTSRRSAKKGETTLHVLPVGAGGETRTIATMKDGVSDVAFSPDGRWVGFISRTPDDRYEAAGAAEGDESWQSPRKIERFFTRLNGEGWVFDRPTHVYYVAADGTSRRPRNLTPGEFQHSGLSWLPDSSGVVTSAPRHDTWDLDFATDLYVVTLAGEIRALTDHTGNYVLPSVSPDGTRVAFHGFDDSSTYPQNVRVGVVPTAGGTHSYVSTALDRTFETTAGSVPPRWLDDSTLLGTAEDRGETHVWRLRTDGTAPQAVTTGASTVKAMHAAGGTVAYIASSVDGLADLFVLTDGEPRRLTSFADDYRHVKPLTWERFAVPCTDGSNEIDAWIMRPHGFDPAQQYPVVLNVHGGPHTQYGETFFDEAQLQAAAGFVVLMSNPRGGSGREQAWGQAIMGPQHPVAPGSGWGGVDVDDVMAVLDTALARYPFCDPARVGMQGGSYGGYMATMLAGRFSNRFKAICTERAVNNVLTEEVNSDIATIFRVEHGPTHIDHPEEYERLSPIRFVRDITCPVLIIHSENDLRCPINQAEELFVAMRLLGKDVTFYRFPGESHELSRSGSPIHRRQRAEIILDFFAKHLNPA
ncbi:MAG: S9 family peptidase [Ilumatobacteraceae bacterium]